MTRFTDFLKDTANNDDDIERAYEEYLKKLKEQCEKEDISHLIGESNS